MKKININKIIDWALLIIMVVYSVFFLKIIVFKYNLFEMERVVNFIPIIGMIDYFKTGETYIALKNILGNVAFFIPLGVFLKLKIKSGKKCILLIGTVTLFIELFQYLFACGISDVDDVILNIIGGVIGIVLYQTILSSIDVRLSKRLATHIFLILFGLAGVWSLYEFQPNMLPIENEYIHKELVDDFIEREDYISGQFEEYGNNKITIYTYEDRKESYIVSANVICIVQTISAEYTDRGDVRKVSSVYEEVSIDNIINALQEKKSISLYTNDKNEVQYILMLVHDSAKGE